MKNVNKLLPSHISFGNVGLAKIAISFSWGFTNKYLCIIAGYEKH